MTSLQKAGRVQKIIATLINFLALSAGREKLCRLVQYITKYLSSSYMELAESSPHLRNQVIPKIRKSDTLSGTMGMTRKVLRFGPSIAQLQSFITNLISLLQGKSKEATPIFISRILSNLWLSGYFIFDHYVWLHKMGIAKNDIIKGKFERWSIVSWYLDCWTALIRNILIYLHLNEKEKEKQSLAIGIDVLRVIMDLPVAYGFLNPGAVNGKIMGACGTVSSLCGIYPLWK